MTLLSQSAPILKRYLREDVGPFAGNLKNEWRASVPAQVARRIQIVLRCEVYLKFLRPVARIWTDAHAAGMKPSKRVLRCADLRFR